MKIQDWKNKELGRLLREKWGLDEKRFANDPKLDKDGDGKPKWADSDDDDPEKLEEKHSDADYMRAQVECQGSSDPNCADKILAQAEKQGLAERAPNQFDEPEAYREYMRQKREKEEKRRKRQEREGRKDEGTAFAPNHYCVHHGGVQHEGKIKMAEAVSHNYDEELGRVTRYDMQLEDGTVLENVAAEDIQVTSASLAEMHHGHRADDDKKKKKKRVVMKQEDQLRERIRTALLKLREQNKI